MPFVREGRLAGVLTYHVVPGKTLTSNKVLKSNGAKLTTAQGGKITVKVKTKPSVSVTLKDRDKNAQDPKAVLKAGPPRSTGLLCPG